MLHTNSSYLNRLPIYNKAIEIFSLSRQISTYLQTDLSLLRLDGSEDKNIYFTGDIVQQSESLAPNILKAEQDADKKHVYVETLNWLTRRLILTCKRLEKSSSNGKDFIPILRKEIRQFRKLQRSWMMTL